MYSPHAFPGVAPGDQYDANANSSLLVVVQLESRSGVENVEKIAAVDGIDVLFIGRLFFCFFPPLPYVPHEGLNSARGTGGC